MSSTSFQRHSQQFKEKMGLRHFPYYTIYFLIIGLHLGRHLEYIEMLNDARVASHGFFMDNICTTRIHKEKNQVPGPPKIRSNMTALTIMNCSMK